MQKGWFIEEEGAHVLDSVVAQIEKTVCLTDDGWEWVEESQESECPVPPDGLEEGDYYPDDLPGRGS